MEKFWIAAVFVLGSLAFAFCAAALWRTDEQHLAAAEKFLRLRKTGAILGGVALAWCVPQIQAVAWNFLIPWLWPLAAAAILGAYFYLDNLMARAIAGLLIMGAYTFLAFSFASRLGTGLSGALAAWGWGSVGILIAAKPCWLRDFLRLGARRSVWRRIAAGCAGVTAIGLAAALVLYLKRS